jgi:hypothetical protein
MKRVVIIGNGGISRDMSPFVDGSDFVVRFNRPASWGGLGGSRFDAWVIANGRGGRAFALQRSFADSPFRDLPSVIWFPRSLALHRQLPIDPAYGGAMVSDPVDDDVSVNIIESNKLQQVCLCFEMSFYLRCVHKLYDLDVTQHVLMPSSGYIAINYVIESMPGADIFLLGFDFQGWAGHPWGLEKESVRLMASQGILKII